MSSFLNVEIAVPRRWARIEPTREAVGSLLEAMFGDEDLKGALAMVSAELLENAVKYSKPESQLRLAVRAEHARIVIAVTNAVDARNAKHLEAHRARFDWLAGFESPAEAYVAALTRFSEHFRPEDRGLGIFRIAYEGGCGVTSTPLEPAKSPSAASCAVPEAA